LCLGLLFGAGLCMAQEPAVVNQGQAGPPDHPWKSSVYCSGFYSDQKVSDDLRLVSGEQSSFKITFNYGNVVYISKGSSQGIKEGDKFSVVRPEDDPVHVERFKWQDQPVNAERTRLSDRAPRATLKSVPAV